MTYEQQVPLVFLDTETDGVGPDRQMWEIAMVRREVDGKESSFEAFVKIDLGKTPDTFGLNVGKFWERHPTGRWQSGKDTGAQPSDWKVLTPETVGSKIARWTHGAHLVGMCHWFDTEVADPMIRAAGHLPMYHYHLIDCETLAVGWLAAQGIQVGPPYSSDELMELLGVENPTDEERHTAMGDVRWIMRVWDKIMEKV